jgi:hypothetical protein
VEERSGRLSSGGIREKEEIRNIRKGSDKQRIKRKRKRRRRGTQKNVLKGNLEERQPIGN